jgi:CRISPR/Cas system-associated exonuclease Cas4 (RecB family)
MMSSLSKDYSDLLDYLKTQKKASEGYALNRRKPSEVKKEQVAQATKKLLEDSQIHSYVPPNAKKQVAKSRGFNVKKFEGMMRAKLIDGFKKMQTYERPYISVGELYTCMRQNYYSRSRYAIDPEEQFRFAWLYMFQRIGEELHAIIQDVYNFTEKEKTIVSEKFKTKGRLDGIRDGFLYEIKSVDPDKFEYEYQQEHFLQGNIYAHILNTEYGYKIHTIVIIYVFRNLKQIVPFDLAVDSPLAESFLKRALILKHALDKKIVPDPIGANASHCQWCSYKKYCEKDKCNEVLQPFNRDKKKLENKIESKPKKKTKVKAKPQPKREEVIKKEPQRKGAFLL